jgi:hypothetical protein
MPWGDGTGPAGFGPMTGRAAGYCAGFPTPGYANPYAGFGAFGWGRGRGWGRGWAFRGGRRGLARSGFGIGRAFRPYYPVAPYAGMYRYTPW